MGLIRLFLALVVAADHWRVFILIPAGTGAEMSDVYKLGFNAGYAVMFFYAISGFLITYTLSRNYERDLAGVMVFYEKRFVRIFALYWPLVLVAFWLIPSSWTAFVSTGVLQKISALMLFGLDWQYTAGMKDPAIVGLSQAWTLGAELLFYLCAPWLMRSWKIGATLMILSLSFRLGFVLLNGPAIDERWTYHFPLATFCFFMFGHLICLASRRWPVLSSPALGWAALILSAAAMVWGGNFADFDGTRLWMSVACFTIALPGVFAATMRVRWMNSLGDLSYPVYLVHLLPLLVVAPMIVQAADLLGSSPYMSVAAFLVVVLVSAIVAHRFIEIPTAYAMRWLIARTRSLPARAP